MCHYKFLVQAVNIPFNTRVYSDLVSVEVPPSGTADKHTIQLPHWQHKSTKPVAEPNIADLYPLTSYVCVVGIPRLHIASRFIINDSMFILYGHSYMRFCIIEGRFPNTIVSSDHCIISETASWDNNWSSHEPQLMSPPVNSVYILYHHMFSVH